MRLSGHLACLCLLSKLKVHYLSVPLVLQLWWTQNNLLFVQRLMLLWKKCAQGLGHRNLRLFLYVPKLKAEKQSILLNFHDRWILSNFWLKSCNVYPKMCRRLAMFAPTCAARWIRLVSGASLAAGPCSLGQLYPGAALCYWRFFRWLPMAGWVCGWQLCWGSPAFQLGGCGWILHGRREWLMSGWLSAFILLVGWLLWI